MYIHCVHKVLFYLTQNEKVLKQAVIEAQEKYKSKSEATRNMKEKAEAKIAEYVLSVSCVIAQYVLPVSYVIAEYVQPVSCVIAEYFLLVSCVIAQFVLPVSCVIAQYVQPVSHMKL